MIKIVNTWKSTKDKKEYYETDTKPVYQNGDYSVYKLWKKNYMYCYKNLAIANLTGLDKEHLDRVANRQEPSEENSRDYFRYHRTLYNMNRALNL